MANNVLTLHFWDMSVHPVLLLEQNIPPAPSLHLPLLPPSTSPCSLPPPAPSLHLLPPSTCSLPPPPPAPSLHLPLLPPSSSPCSLPPPPPAPPSTSPFSPSNSPFSPSNSPFSPSNSPFSPCPVAVAWGHHLHYCWSLPWHHEVVWSQCDHGGESLQVEPQAMPCLRLVHPQHTSQPICRMWWCVHCQCHSLLPLKSPLACSIGCCFFVQMLCCTKCSLCLFAFGAGGIDPAGKCHWVCEGWYCGPEEPDQAAQKWWNHK